MLRGLTKVIEEGEEIGMTLFFANGLEHKIVLVVVDVKNEGQH